MLKYLPLLGGILFILSSLIPVKAQTGDALLHRLYISYRKTGFLTTGQDVDRLYTTDSSEASRSGYKYEGVVGKCFSQQRPGTSPLYRLYKSSITDHFYTTDEVEKNAAISRDGYVYERVECYVYTDQKPGTCPLYRLYAAYISSNHFYTLSKYEMEQTVAGYTDRNGNYKYEGIAGYLQPYNTPTCPK